MARADFCELGFDVGGVDGIGGLAEEAEEDGAVGGVADASEGEGAEEVYGEGLGVGEAAGVGEVADEAEGGTHGADGVRAGGTDADLEELKEAGVHQTIVVGGRRPRGSPARLSFGWPWLCCLRLS